MTFEINVRRPAVQASLAFCRGVGRGDEPSSASLLVIVDVAVGLSFSSKPILLLDMLLLGAKNLDETDRL